MYLKYICGTISPGDITPLRLVRGTVKYLPLYDSQYFYNNCWCKKVFRLVLTDGCSSLMTFNF